MTRRTRLAVARWALLPILAILPVLPIMPILPIMALLSAAGAPLHAAQGVASGEDAASLYRRAALLMRGTDGDGLLSSDDEIAIADLRSPADLTPATRAALARARPILELVRQAARQERADFGIDRGLGFAVLLPHLSDLRAFTRLMRADIAAGIAEGDASRAVEGLGLMAGLASHATSDALMISSLVGMANAGAVESLVGDAIDRGLLEAEAARSLVEGLGPVRGVDPFRLGDAMDGERDMLRTSVMQALDGPRDEEAGSILDLLVAQGGAGVAAEFDDRESILAQLASTEMLLARSAEAFRMPDTAAARQVLTEVEAAVADGAAGMLGEMLMPALLRAFESKLRVEGALAARVAQLSDLASGRTTPADLANAAVWYLAAARAAEALAPEEQRLLELVRALGDPADEALSADFDALVERSRESVIEPLLRGAEAGRCAFVRDRAGQRRLEPIPAHLAGLRAATRLLLADAMRLAHRPAGDGAAAADDRRAASILVRLDAALAVAHHLASDATVPHALLARSILEETVASLEAIVRLDALRAWPPAELAGLRRRAALLDRLDPCGHRRAVAVDRETLLGMLPRGDDALRRAQRRLVDRLDGNAIVAIGVMAGWPPGHEPEPQEGADEDPEARARLVRERAALQCGARPDEVALDLRDLYDLEGCIALAPRSGADGGPNEFRESPLFQADSAERLRGVEAPFAHDAPRIVDTAASIARASAAIVRLDETLRLTPP